MINPMDCECSNWARTDCLPPVGHHPSCEYHDTFHVAGVVVGISPGDSDVSLTERELAALQEECGDE